MLHAGCFNRSILRRLRRWWIAIVSCLVMLVMFVWFPMLGSVHQQYAVVPALPSVQGEQIRREGRWSDLFAPPVPSEERFTAAWLFSTPSFTSREVLRTLPPIQNVAAKIKPGRFVYMVTGKGEPSLRWKRRSTWEHVTVIYLAWGDDFTKSVKHIPGQKLIPLFLPNSTWTTGRNKLLKSAYQLEKDQGWCFEFLLYFDEDVYFSQRLASHPETVITDKSSDDAQLLWLHNLLLRDRPMRASVSYKDVASRKYPWNTAASLECMQQCHVDHLFMAYHRTATPFLLPYDSRFDAEDWWSSAYISNLFMAAVLPMHCAYYREILILNDDKQQHGYYRIGAYSELFKSAKRHVQNCLGRVHYNGYRVNGSLEKFFVSLLGAMVPHEVNIPDDKACLRGHPGIDYLTRLGVGAHLFTCPVVSASPTYM